MALAADILSVSVVPFPSTFLLNPSLPRSTSMFVCIVGRHISIALSPPTYTSICPTHPMHLSLGGSSYLLIVLPSHSFYQLEEETDTFLRVCVCVYFDVLKRGVQPFGLSVHSPDSPHFPSLVRSSVVIGRADPLPDAARYLITFRCMVYLQHGDPIKSSHLCLSSFVCLPLVTPPPLLLRIVSPFLVACQRWQFRMFRRFGVHHHSHPQYGVNAVADGKNVRIRKIRKIE